jgi:hypothetical protein
MEGGVGPERETMARHGRDGNEERNRNKAPRRRLPQTPAVPLTVLGLTVDTV